MEQAEEGTGLVDCFGLGQWVTHAWGEMEDVLLQLEKVYRSEMKKQLRRMPYLKHAGTRVSHSTERGEYLRTLRDAPL
jgi:hypothetical protein